jgi:hypothetical protein
VKTRASGSKICAADMSAFFGGCTRAQGQLKTTFLVFGKCTPPLAGLSAGDRCRS